MKEKQLKAAPGMPVLFISIVLYLVAIGFLVLGGILLEHERNIGALPLALGIIGMIVGVFPFAGLKVLKPNEALVLTLFGKYTGTLRAAGFYFVHPFSVAVNPAAQTKLGQSGDVKTTKHSVTVSSEGTKVEVDAAGKRISSQGHDA